ncbi:GNAT family N-acetyltransferase [Rhodobacteraceae bacterium B1Z28]|uniref:GNAT family N-acetyltransferase n=1 Tax=Ruegeria haliotis TaxID=2747601 RepID=A0ABX2PMY1_9RHOB|nr:GNAT family N-acetyltransferase [Ruegeria haliotis]NVO54801.1 GNAT family N-acetyltransferase [Ruegeria haliotis]
MEDVVLRPFRPDDAPWLVEQHGTLYARDEGFDSSFAPLVAQILDDFIADHDLTREQGWIAEQAGKRLGSIFCVSLDRNTAKLRLFLLMPQARGLGLGKRLLSTCTGFARAAGYREMALWTHESHKAACALYRANGWQLTDSKPVHSFGVDLIEQSWEIQL